jgi:GxxExxY protein
MADLIYKDESYAIMGACFEVYKEKGCGFLEPVYQECLELELQERGIPFVSQPRINIDYKGTKLKHPYAADLICYGKIIIELKAVSGLIDEHRAQLHNYLRATGLQLGILVNFGHHPKLEYERIAMTQIRNNTREQPKSRTEVRATLSRLSRI